MQVEFDSHVCFGRGIRYTRGFRMRVGLDPHVNAGARWVRNARGIRKHVEFDSNREFGCMLDAMRM